MTVPYRSTHLAMASRHCPAAMGFAEAGEPYDRRPFEIGIAAHAILEHVARVANERDAEIDADAADPLAREVGEALIARGRSFDGVPEPPLRPESVWAGRDLALSWLTREPASPGAQLEIGIAVDRDFRPVGYFDERAWLRAAIDSIRVGEREDEESAARVVTVRDYKTSWAADEGELETIQRRVQAVLAWEHFGSDAQAIRLEVVNLRTLKVLSAEYWPTDGDVTLDTWRDDLVATLRAYDAQRQLAGGLPAIPGGGCYGCPWLSRCNAAQSWLAPQRITASSEDRAKVYVVAEALRESLREGLKADSELAPIPVPGGVVGTVGAEVKALRSDAYVQLWQEWSGRGGDPLGFARALSLTSGNADALARVLYPTRKEIDARRHLLSEVLTTKIERSFGFHADAGEEDIDATA